MDSTGASSRATGVDHHLGASRRRWTSRRLGVVGGAGEWQSAGMVDGGAAGDLGVNGVGDWRVVGGGVSAWFGAASQVVGAGLVGRIAELVGSDGRLPDVDLRAGGVHVRVGVPGGAGLTDVELARAISAAAGELGLVGDPSVLQSVQVVVDAIDQDSVKVFWHAVLGGYEHAGDPLVDPLRRDPVFVFRRREDARPLRNRIHVDVGRPQPEARGGLEAVKVAGGRATYSSEWYSTLADAEGNEADLVPGGELDEAADWRTLFGAMTFYPCESPTQAAELAARVAELADEAGTPLMIDLRPDGVTIDSGKDEWEVDGFADLARPVQAAARDLGLTADTSRLRFVQVGMDAVDVPHVREFWRAVLGYEHDRRPFLTDIYDPRRLNPVLFFQQMDASEDARRRQLNRMHLTLFVPDDQAQARIDTALAAGGRVVHHDEAAKRWTLTDPEGNELEIVG